MGDMDSHAGTFNILILQMADFTDTQAGRIHECDHCLLLQIRNGGDESPDFLLGRDKRKIFIKSAHGKLGIVPGLMQDI